MYSYYKMNSSQPPATATPSQSMTPTPSGPSASQIPDLMKIGAIQDQTTQDVETDVLEPVVQSEKFIRFQLQNKGILHSHSKIQFQLGAGATSYLPANVGIASLIQRATLKVGNKTLCEVDDFNHLQAYKSMFMSSESMRERLMYQTGQMMSHEFCYNNEGGAGDVSAPSANGGGASSTEALGVGIDTGNNYDTSPLRTTGNAWDYSVDQALTPQKFLNLENRFADHKPPSFQIALSDLFSFLKINQLPLYMMREAIQLEFVLTDPNSSLRAFVDESSTEGNPTISLDTTATRMIADYIYYPQEMMVAYANANKKLQFSYVDYRLSKQSVDNDTFTGQQIRNVGGAGRMVTKIMWSLSDTGLGVGKAQQTLLNNYNARCPTRTYAALPGGYLTNKNGTSTFNVKYNDNFLYPIDVKNNARHFHNVVQAEQLVPFVNREEYSGEGVSVTRRDLSGYNQNTSLGQKFFHGAARLLTNERINSRGIELYTDYNALPVGESTMQRVFLEIVRYAVIEDGITECYYA